MKTKSKIKLIVAFAFLGALAIAVLAVLVALFQADWKATTVFLGLPVGMLSLFWSIGTVINWSEKKGEFREKDDWR